MNEKTFEGMNEKTYEAPSLSTIGSLHEMTLQNKDFTGIDGIVLQPGDVPLGPAS